MSDVSRIFNSILKNSKAVNWILGNSKISLKLRNSSESSAEVRNVLVIQNPQNFLEKGTNLWTIQGLFCLSLRREKRQNKNGSDSRPWQPEREQWPLIGSSSVYPKQPLAKNPSILLINQENQKRKMKNLWKKKFYTQTWRIKKIKIHIFGVLFSNASFFQRFKDLNSWNQMQLRNKELEILTFRSLHRIPEIREEIIL